MPDQLSLFSDPMQMLAHGIGVITRASRQIHSPRLAETSGQLRIFLEGPDG